MGKICEAKSCHLGALLPPPPPSPTDLLDHFSPESFLWLRKSPTESQVARVFRRISSIFYKLFSRLVWSLGWKNSSYTTSQRVNDLMSILFFSFSQLKLFTFFVSLLYIFFLFFAFFFIHLFIWMDELKILETL